MPLTVPVDLFAPVRQELSIVEARLHQAYRGSHPNLAAAAEHLLTAGGKRLRPAISLLSAGLFEVPGEPAIALATAVEMLHTATLVHDDLIDGANLRRGQSTLNTAWSPHATVLMGDYLFACAAHLAAQTDHPGVIRLFAQTLMVIIGGEIRQYVSGRRNLQQQDYYERIYAKTAALFALAAEAAAILGGADEACVDQVRTFGRELGMAFQIVDDVLDFVGAPEQLGKPAGSDLRQGLFTLPALYYLQTHPDDAAIQALLNGGEGDARLVAQVVEAVRRSPAIDQAMGKARAFAQRGEEALNGLPASNYRSALSQIARYSVQREL